MRLLQIRDTSTFSLVDFMGSNAPPYAILSHTWGLDHEEVNFKDMTCDTGFNKPGYRKLNFCAKQAIEDGLGYFWIDTCCIDKSSSAELTEAINSMFQWYHKAERCYVYLADVPLHEGIIDEHTLQSSRWFSRGWTLQELLAPKCVQFYSAAGEPLGSRASLIQKLHNVTGISPRALEGEDLHHFSIEMRFSWAAHRDTKREEDAAYSLLGIFGVHMPLIYGEGRRNAFVRLRKAIEDSLTYQDVDLDFSWTSSAATSDDFRRTTSSNDFFPKAKPSAMPAQRHSHISQATLDSFRYPRMEERRLQIQHAQSGTYKWILDAASRYNLEEDNFLTWLSSVV